MEPGPKRPGSKPFSGWVMLGVAFSLVLLVAAVPQNSPASQKSPEEFRISTDVERVLLPVTVKDRRGELVRGLEKINFRILEDGRPADIKSFSSGDIPVTVGLVMDNSASMRGKKQETTLAALNFIRQSNPRDEMFVVNFNERVYIGDQSMTSDPARLADALNMSPPDGKTALYDAIATGIERLDRGTCDKKALLVVSDGGDNASRHTLDDVLALARKSDALIYTIGIYEPDDPERKPGVLKKLAKLTGGESYFPERLPDIRELCVHIAHDLRNQYTIGFAPAGPRHDGEFHRIQVIATAPDGRKLTVRTRPGYYDPAQPSAQERRLP